MFTGLIAGAAALALPAMPVIATASPASAPSLRAVAELQDENELAVGILVALVGVALAALVVVAVTDDDDDEELPVSA